MPARISEIGMIETWRGGAIVTGAVAEAGDDPTGDDAAEAALAVAVALAALAPAGAAAAGAAKRPRIATGR